MILPVVLLILILLGMMAASASFYVHADLSATRSLSHRLQTRLAAESGLQKVMLFLRANRNNPAAWYHNPEEFHRIIVWSDIGGLEALGTNTEFDESDRVQAYRFSIVADDPTDDEKLVRFGITDESSKLNLNVASRAQLLSLIERFATEDMVVEELVDALIDWRDANKVPGEFGAEDQYYAQLDPPYAVKNAPLDTVEELLLVRGFTGELLYGEDFDRNGLMSPNENDGDLLFPPDNADDKLDRGLYPFVTVYSRDMNTTFDNKPRVYLLGDSAIVQAQLSEFVDDQTKLNFIAAAGSSQPPLTSPAGLLADRSQQTSDDVIASPITEEDMVWIMDRCTMLPTPELVGLININTAEAEVLSTLTDLTADDVAEIISTRAELSDEDRISTGWLAPVIGREKFIAVAPLISAGGTRFHVESLGYGDHIGAMSRLEAIIEMRGPVAQIVYNRDLTTLGTSFPIRYAEGDSKLEGFN